MTASFFMRLPFITRRWQLPGIAVPVFFLACLLSACGGNTRNEALDRVVIANRLLPDNLFTAQSPEVATGTGTFGATGVLAADPASGRVRAAVIVSGIAMPAVALAPSSGGGAAVAMLALLETSPGSGIWTGEATFSSAQLSALYAGQVQFQARSAGLPGGALSGQFQHQLPANTVAAPGSAGQRLVLTNVLSGSQEVPPARSSAISAGIAVADAFSKILTAVVVSSGIAGTEAHIHDAAPGSTGPAILPLAQTAPASGIWFTRASLSDSQLADLADGHYYFDIHSVSQPAGEIRGQIVDLNRQVDDDCGIGPPWSGNCWNGGAGSGIGLTIGFGSIGGAFFSDANTTMD